MSLFLSESERGAIHEARRLAPLKAFYWALLNRVEKRAACPGVTPDTTTQWWHHTSEYLTDAAMADAISYKPLPAVRAWLREAVLAVVRRPIADWVGPDFRDHTADPPVGHLETAHLSWGVAIALDLAPDVFTEAEREEIAEALKQKGIEPCRRWLEQHHHMANWRCILNAGVAVAAAVLADKNALDFAKTEYFRCLGAFQPDGSYSESLQYGNYAAYHLMLTHEALIRHEPSLQLPLEPYAHKPRWDAASHFYRKPLNGWGTAPRPRAANFNDSAALYQPSADLLLHIAARARHAHPTSAQLARWLFDLHYTPYAEVGPHDRASFGFINDFGFLTFPLLPLASEPLSPSEAGLGRCEAFSCGDIFARDAWEAEGGRTVLAVRAGGDPLHGPGHLHGDVNSFILAHNNERLLVDPGHSCYRGLLHQIEVASHTHNTCTFFDPATRRGLQQSVSARRWMDSATHELHPPVPSRGTRLLATGGDGILAIASECAALYGEPLTRFARFWFLCGSHVLFIVDHIQASTPLRTTWHWLLNNRDAQLDLKIFRPDRFVARRGHAAMKFFHGEGARFESLAHAHIHDAYHPLPNQLGEGASGTGSLLRWTQDTPAAETLAIHAICLDDPAGVTEWHGKPGQNSLTLDNPARQTSCTLRASPDASTIHLTENLSHLSAHASQHEGAWLFKTSQS